MTDFAAVINIAAVFISWVLRKPEKTLCANLLFSEYCTHFTKFANYTCNRSWLKNLNCSYRDQKNPPKNKPEIKIILHPRIQTNAEKYQSLTPNELISPRSFSLLNQPSWRCGILVSHQVHNHEHWGATVCF